MNRSFALLTASVLVAMAFMGCLRPDPNFNSPITTWPKISVDFVDNVTKVYVKGLNDYRYENITMREFHGNLSYMNSSETHTYVMYRSFKQREFILNITVWDKQTDKVKIFTFEGNFTVHPAGEPTIVVQISYVNQEGALKVEKLKENDLPKSIGAIRIQ